MELLVNPLHLFLSSLLCCCSTTTLPRRDRCCRRRCCGTEVSSEEEVQFGRWTARNIGRELGTLVAPPGGVDPFDPPKPPSTASLRHPPPRTLLHKGKTDKSHLPCDNSIKCGWPRRLTTQHANHDQLSDRYRPVLTGVHSLKKLRADAIRADLCLQGANYVRT